MSEFGEGSSEISPRKDEVAEIAEQVAAILPEYSSMDRAEYDSYDADQDKQDRGRILTFYTTQGREESSPRLFFIFRPSGFTMNYRNSPEPQKPYTIRNVSDSIYAPTERKWRSDEVDLAFETAKIHMEGIDTNSDAFKDQLAGWSEELGRFVTMQESIDGYREYRDAAKTFKAKIRRKYEPGLALDQKKATELIAQRLTDKGELMGQGVREELGSYSVGGRNIVRVELNQIYAQVSLLADRGLLPRVIMHG